MTEKELILTTIKHCSRASLYDGSFQLSEEEEILYYNYLDRFNNGEPLQYILGRASFLDLDLKVSKGVLIPRPETELLVDYCIKALKKLNREQLQILDIGTGSGNIALALAQAFPKSEIVTCDSSDAAIMVAEENVRRYELENRITCICQPAEALLPRFIEEEISFDLIVSNPPYIATEKLGQLPVDVQQEPVSALDGQEDGLYYYRMICKWGRSLFKEKSLLCFEIGETQSNEVSSIIQEKISPVSIQTYQDLAGQDRIILAEINN